MNRCCVPWLLLLGVLGPATANAQIVSAGADTITGDGGPDGWTNVLYINEANPFSFAGTGQTQGVLTTFNFWAARGIGVVTPFVAEPLVPDPVSGSDYVIRAIGTTREGGTDWQCIGEYALAFHETEQFTVQEGWVAGFVSWVNETMRCLRFPLQVDWASTAG